LQQTRKVDFYVFQLVAKLVEGQERSQLEYLCGQPEDFDKVLDGFATHRFLLLRENVEQKGQSLLLRRIFADVQHDLGKVNECEPDYLRDGIKNVLPQFHVFDVFEHSAENLVNLLCRFVLYLLHIEVLDVLNLNGLQLGGAKYFFGCCYRRLILSRPLYQHFLPFHLLY